MPPNLNSWLILFSGESCWLKRIVVLTHRSVLLTQAWLISFETSFLYFCWNRWYAYRIWYHYNRLLTGISKYPVLFLKNMVVKKCLSPLRCICMHMFAYWKTLNQSAGLSAVLRRCIQWKRMWIILSPDEMSFSHSS